MRLSSGIAWCAGFLLCGLSLGLADDAEAKLLPDGPGKDVTARVCFDCHGGGSFRKLRLGKEEWEDKVAEMVDRGAKAIPAEMAAIVDYLTLNFGPDSKINVNSAPLMEFKNILGVSAQEAQSLVEYRDKNGKFHTWQDLQKVPGVDGQKIEAKKDLMVF